MSDGWMDGWLARWIYLRTLLLLEHLAVLINIIVLSVPSSEKRFHIELKVLVEIVRWIRKLLQRVMLHNGGERAVRRCVIEVG